MNVIWIFIALLIVSVILIIVSLRLYKAEINKKMKNDMAYTEQSGTPPINRNHVSVSWDTLFGIIIAIGVLILIFVIMITINSNTGTSVGELEYNLNQRYYSLRDELRYLEELEKKDASLFSSVVYDTEEGSFDSEKNTFVLKVDFIPKQYSDDTTVTVYIGDEVCEAERNGNVFTINYERPIGINVINGGSIIASVTTGGVTSTEIISESDAELFTLEMTSSFVPTVVSTSYSKGDAPKYKKGVMTVDQRFRLDICKPQYSDAYPVSCVITACAGDKTVFEKDVTDMLTTDGSLKVWRTGNIEMKFSEKIPENEKLKLYITITDSNGYRRIEANNLCYYEEEYCLSEVTDKNGNTVYRYLFEG